MSFVSFYAPWCGFCKALAGEWRPLAEGFSDAEEPDGGEGGGGGGGGGGAGGGLLVTKVDCTAPGARRLCAGHGVHEYPTILLFKPDGARVEFTGARNAVKMRAFLGREGTKDMIRVEEARRRERQRRELAAQGQ